VTRFDVVGVGLNATDTLIVAEHYPRCGGKTPFEEETLSPGGQVATALTACVRLGLRAKYIGVAGDDERGRVQLASLRETGMNLDDLEIRAGCANQSAYIVIDRSSGERTVFWNRPECLKLDPASITPEKIGCARLLHIDGHDTAAVAQAARLARRLGVPVTVDVDTIYPGFDLALESVDYLVASAEFPARWTGETDPFRALEKIRSEYGMRVAAMTLGENGALALDSGGFTYSPGFRVDCLDTTGAGDVFHGAFCYSVLAGTPLGETLEFSNAMAALNCTRLGARGGIAAAAEVRAFQKKASMRSDARKSEPAYAAARRA
jgi:sulfofructose kinase